MPYVGNEPTSNFASVTKDLFSGDGSTVAFTLSKVCFVVLSLTLLAGENIKIGGLALNTLKKLKGERLGLPSESMVLANAMGLGATAANK